MIDMDESTRTEILNALAELRKLEGSRTNFLPGEEITGEFLGEMKSIEQGVAVTPSSMRPSALKITSAISVGSMPEA